MRVRRIVYRRRSLSPQADGQPAAALAEVWNGTSWSTQPPANAGQSDTLNGVSCTAAGCTAVGSFQPAGGGELPLGELSWTASA